MRFFRLFMLASGGMATDILQGVPELLVDIDGNVELRGNTPQIYINGRPAPMEGESLQLFLQQFPADRIDRIEVIPNPSARFQAEVEVKVTGRVFLDDELQRTAGSCRAFPARLRRLPEIPLATVLLKFPCCSHGLPVRMRPGRKGRARSAFPMPAGTGKS